jgi:hypothetical protein
VVVRTRQRRPESLDLETTAERIIGRPEELQTLASFVDAVPTGGHALLLEGDAGIGKTALWQEGTAAARRSDVRVLAARAGQAETQIALATVGDLFAPTLDETLPRLPPVQRRALEIALLLREPDGPPPEVRVLGLALVSAVRALARAQPVLLALDDVQWVDASSAEILAFMLRRLEGEPVGVLATVRGRPVRAPHELDRAFAVFERLPCRRSTASSRSARERSSRHASLRVERVSVAISAERIKDQITELDSWPFGPGQSVCSGPILGLKRWRAPCTTGQRNTGAGSAAAPRTRTSKWRCGPLTNTPVAPTAPICVPAPTLCPTCTSIRDRCA